MRKVLFREKNPELTKPVVNNFQTKAEPGVKTGIIIKRLTFALFKPAIHIILSPKQSVVQKQITKKTKKCSH